MLDPMPQQSFPFWVDYAEATSFTQQGGQIAEVSYKPEKWAKYPA